MKWTDQPAEVLLQRSFLFGMTGIVLGALSVLNTYFQLVQAPMGPLHGVGLALQIIGLSLAILVIRKRNLSPEIKERAKKMILVLGVALIFFFLV